VFSHAFLFVKNVLLDYIQKPFGQVTILMNHCVDYLLTWNYRHIAKMEIQRSIADYRIAGLFATCYVYPGRTFRRG
jgi:hypothetical protein